MVLLLKIGWKIISCRSNRPTRCSEPLRYKVGGPKRSSPDCAGWDRLGKTGGRWFFLTHSNMFEVDICGFVIRSFHFLGKLLQ